MQRRYVALFAVLSSIIVLLAGACITVYVVRLQNEDENDHLDEDSDLTQHASGTHGTNGSRSPSNRVSKKPSERKDKPPINQPPPSPPAPRRPSPSPPKPGPEEDKRGSKPPNIDGLDTTLINLKRKKKDGDKLRSSNESEDEPDVVPMNVIATIGAQSVEDIENGNSGSRALVMYDPRQNTLGARLGELGSAIKDYAWSALSFAGKYIPNPTVLTIINYGGDYVLVKVVQTPLGQQVAAAVLGPMIPGIDAASAGAYAAAALGTWRMIWGYVKNAQIAWQGINIVKGLSRASHEKAMRMGIQKAIMNAPHNQKPGAQPKMMLTAAQIAQLEEIASMAASCPPKQSGGLCAGSMAIDQKSNPKGNQKKQE